MDILILICVGASEFAFDRLLKIVDQLCEEGIMNGNYIVAQIGVAKYIPQNYKYFEVISHSEFKEFEDKADYIISHAGTGCVIPALKKNKKVIVFPRDAKYGEHIDNHQYELAEIFSAAGFILSASNKKELIECINKINEFIPKKFQSNSKNFNQLIINFIEEMC